MDKKNMVVLLAEDNESDVMAMKRAWDKNKIPHSLYIVSNGEECLDFLHRRGLYAEPEKAPRPGILLLDIRMPKMDGLEVLKHIRENNEYRGLPVIVLTTSTLEEDRLKSYELGANAFIVKPVGFENLSHIVKTISDFWQMVDLPHCKENLYEY